MLSNFTNIFSTGTANCVKFEQIPLLIANQSSKAQINCKHNDSSLAVMLWYRQQSMSLDLIGYGYAGSSPNYEPGFTTNRFTQTRQDTVTGSLIISDLDLSDTAIYYCAASTQCCKISFYWQKNPLPYLRYVSPVYVTVKYWVVNHYQVCYKPWLTASIKFLSDAENIRQYNASRILTININYDTLKL